MNRRGKIPSPLEELYAELRTLLGNTFAVAHGANVYTVQRIVGHSKPSITLDVYGELWDDSQEQLVEKLDAAIRAESAAPSQGVDVVEMPAKGYV